jgi:hypothetical protein
MQDGILVSMNKRFLLRYDTEGENAEEMAGFLEKVVAVHREHAIPATFFCMGRAMEQREARFRDFHKEVQGDPLFDIQDHSYSHVGLGYAAGQDVETLKVDYERSFAIHERIFGRRPIGIGICGTAGRDGDRLKGFDETAKSRAELDMIASLGVRMINAFLSGVDESKTFIDFSALGHPEIMGFPSGFGDTGWMDRRECGEPVPYILGQIADCAEREEHVSVVLHDWVAWTRAEDQELTHVKRMVEVARKRDFDLVTHAACLPGPTEI